MHRQGAPLSGSCAPVGAPAKAVLAVVAIAAAGDGPVLLNWIAGSAGSGPCVVEGRLPALPVQSYLRFTPNSARRGQLALCPGRISCADPVRTRDRGLCH